MSLYVATEGLATSRNGQLVRVYTGDLAEEGSWILEVAPNSFRPADVKFPAPVAVASEPVKRGPGRPRKNEAE